MKCITTSWDDGHPLDFALADLLEKYRIKATFYIPKHNVEHTVMEENKIVELAQRFEIGGHTLNHMPLRSCTLQVAKLEIEQGYNWLNKLLEKKTVCFCPPRGQYNDDILKAVKDTGFELIRTVSLFSTDNPSLQAYIDTTFQVYEHSRLTYFKHLLKRFNYQQLIWWLNNNTTADLIKLIELKIETVLKKGGCIHIWGHSWEIENYSLWPKLESILKLLSNINEFEYVENKDLLKYRNQINSA